MKSTVHITNGDCVADTLREAIEGEVMPWRDVLHDGPVPDVDHATLRRIRAEFLQHYSQDAPETIEAELAQRDAKLVDTSAYGSRLLWFEHDLYDQLQLLQILDALSALDEPGPVALICIDRFPGIERFKGLGQLTADQLLTLLPRQVEVAPAMLDLAKRGWKAIRSNDPTSIEAFLETDTSALPFLKAALQRFLEQYPSYVNGLSENESLILKKLSVQPTSAQVLFVSDWEGDRASYLGDYSFFDILERLFPLVAHENKEPFQWTAGQEVSPRPLQLTTLGREVLEGKRDWLKMRGINRWVGGVHLTNPAEGWRWDVSARKLRYKSG